MSKAIATKLAVYAAADALRARGVDPTYELIVAALGGGSNATVGPHLASWRQSSHAPAKPVPESVEIRAKIFVEAVWTAAVRENLADIDHAKQRTDSLIEQAEQALASSIAISQKLEAKRDDLLTRVAEIGDQCTELRFQLRQVDKLTLDLARAEQIAEDRRVQCEVLTRENFALKNVNEELREQGRQLLHQLSHRQHTRAQPRRPKSNGTTQGS